MGIYLVSRPSVALQQADVRGLKTWALHALHALASLKARHTPRQQMRLVEKLELGGRRQLLLVSCSGERFLVGAGADNVQSITRLRPDAAERAGMLVTQTAGDRG